MALENIEYVMLDTWSLIIDHVEMDKNKVQFQLNDKKSPIGKQLQITVGTKLKPLKAHTVFNVTIQYQTTAESKALNFLYPNQTSSQVLPYVFT